MLKGKSCSVFWDNRVRLFNGWKDFLRVNMQARQSLAMRAMTEEEQLTQAIEST